MAVANAIWGVIPVKDLNGAKQRLSPVLSAGERRALSRAMLEDVLAMLVTVRDLAGVALVTRDEEAMALGRNLGARIIAEAENRGHAAAVSAAAKLLAAEGAAGLLQVPGDVPMATAAEVEVVLAAHGGRSAVTLVPSWDKRGSNCVVASPPDAIPFLFGDDSFRPHCEAARRRGIEPTILQLPGLGLDIDTPDDLASLAGFLGVPSCRALLRPRLFRVL